MTAQLITQRFLLDWYSRRIESAESFNGKLERAIDNAIKANENYIICPTQENEARRDDIEAEITGLDFIDVDMIKKQRDELIRNN